MIDQRRTTATPQERSAATPGWKTYRAFGLTWKTDIPWPATREVEGNPEADVQVRLVDSAEVERRWSGHAESPDWYLRIDEKLLTAERGLEGDFRLSHSDRLFHVSADGRSIACATSDPTDPWWLRVLLDTVLWSTALLRGVEALHASAVEGEYGVVAFLSGTGGGKTTLALEFLRRGNRLFCDDILALRQVGGTVTAYPSPPFLNVPDSYASDRTLPISPIATLGDEVWSATGPASVESAPLAHVVLLERTHVPGAEISEAQSGLFELRRSCLAHGLIPGRERARFELCADLAAQVPVSRLRASLETPPSDLADLVEAAVDRAERVS